MFIYCCCSRSPGEKLIQSFVLQLSQSPVKHKSTTRDLGKFLHFLQKVADYEVFKAYKS